MSYATDGALSPFAARQRQRRFDSNWSTSATAHIGSRCYAGMRDARRRRISATLLRRLTRAPSLSLRMSIDRTTVRFTVPARPARSTHFGSEDLCWEPSV